MYIVIHVISVKDDIIPEWIYKECLITWVGHPWGTDVYTARLSLASDLCKCFLYDHRGATMATTTTQVLLILNKCQKSHFNKELSTLRLVDLPTLSVGFDFHLFLARSLITKNSIHLVFVGGATMGCGPTSQKLGPSVMEAQTLHWSLVIDSILVISCW